MESLIQDPNVQELIREWEDKGRSATCSAMADAGRQPLPNSSRRALPRATRSIRCRPA
jgi:hypothetical protein